MSRGYNSHARRKNVNENYFKNIDTSEKAYWLGFIQADGCIYQQETTYRFQINLSGKDKGHLKKLNNHLSSTYTVSERKVIVKGKEYETCSLKINSKPFCENLIMNGITPQKTLNDAFPNLRKDLMSHYLRGFFDGDGGIKIDSRPNTIRSTISFAGGEEFLIKLGKYLSEIGIVLSKKAIVKTHNSKAYVLTINSKDNIIKLYDHIYKNQTICLDRKIAKYHKVLERYEYSPLQE